MSWLPETFRSLLGFEVSDLEFVEPLEKRFTCPVCQNVLWLPIQLSCGHSVCGDCLEKVFKNNDTATCPVNVYDDCKNIKRNGMKCDFSVFYEVRELKVKCAYTKYGCSHVISLYDLKDHLEDCQDKIVPCKYRCGVKTMRKDLVSHYEICTVGISKKVEEQSRQIRDLTEEVTNLKLQMNAKAGKNDVKSRGKIPSWHKTILKKNYISIMENIRVNDIMDHLFGSEVIDDNGMDVIKTKLESKGNREALSYLMNILFRSSHTALTTFINCLNQTGYEYIATSLQEDIDNYGCGEGR